MRVLHLIGSTPTPDAALTATLAQIQAQAERVETVLMAPDGTPHALSLLQQGVPVLWLKPRQSLGDVAAALQVLQPDLIHLHGACDSEAAVPLRVFSHRALVVELNRADTDGAGRLRRDLRGLRLDWRARGSATALCPAGLVADDAVARAGLPAGLGDVTLFNPAEVSAPWFISLYRRVLLAGQPHGKELALPGFA
jgi:hypothetical protein